VLFVHKKAATQNIFLEVVFLPNCKGDDRQTYFTFFAFFYRTKFVAVTEKTALQKKNGKRSLFQGQCRREEERDKIKYKERRRLLFMP
jgi:hypothetical protein